MRGRKRRQGKREPNGRLKRNNYPMPVYDRGSDWVQARRALFGEHYSSAIGRAYAGGLLGDGTEAKNRLDTGKRFAALYSAIIGQGGYRCALDVSPRSAVRSTAFHGHSRDRDDQDWLFGAMNALDREGLRPWFDQLVSPLYTDAGPYWLDAILAGGSHPADHMILKYAVAAIDMIAPTVQPARILAVTG